MNDVHRILRSSDSFEIFVPHAACGIAPQDATHRLSWTHTPIDHFAEGNFSWYSEDEPFDFDLLERDVTVWVRPERLFSGIRSKKIQLLDQLFATEDEYAFQPEADASLRIPLRKKL